MSLATKYRPQRFEDVCEQNTIIKILEKQLEKRNFSNCYLFTGKTGAGKTTIARIFANRINNNQGTPIEIDGASNNGVDNIRNIIDQSKERSLESEYKVFIIDEAHMITTAGWNAFLKTLEEPPKYTIFMFCTTNPEKIPETILNRLMRFNLSRISVGAIEKRLEFISQNENFTNYKETCEYISKVSDGSMRNAIAMLEKCANYSKELNIDTVLEVLGNFSYDTFFRLTNDLIDSKEQDLITIIENVYNDGKSLNSFIQQYFEFIMDLTKYCIFKSMSKLKIPLSKEEDVKYTTSIEDNNKYFNSVKNKLLEVLNLIKNSSIDKSLIEAYLLSISRGEM